MTPVKGTPTLITGNDDGVFMPPIAEPASAVVSGKSGASTGSMLPKKPKSHKRSKRVKRPSNVPTRALNAYNFFFREQRKLIVEERDREVEPSKKLSGADLFSAMGKEIAGRWKKLTPELHQKYVAMAEVDKDRYEREVDEYNRKLDSCRNVALEEKEATAAPVTTSTTSASFDSPREDGNVESDAGLQPTNIHAPEDLRSHNQVQGRNQSELLSALEGELRAFSGQQPQAAQPQSLYQCFSQHSAEPLTLLAEASRFVHPNATALARNAADAASLRMRPAASPAPFSMWDAPAPLAPALTNSLDMALLVRLLQNPSPLPPQMNISQERAGFGMRNDSSDTLQKILLLQAILSPRSG